MEDLCSKNWIKVDGRIRCGCGMVESDNLIFIKKLLQVTAKSMFKQAMASRLKRQKTTFSLLHKDIR